MKRVILVDGPKSSERAAVAEQLAYELHAYHHVGRISTLPDTYVRMMTPAIDNERHVVIECSWITQRTHAPLMPAAWLRMFNDYMAQRLMLDRLALGCSGISVQIFDHTHELFDIWSERPASAVPSVHILRANAELAMAVAVPFMQRQLLNKGPGIGRWAPGHVVLLVGDQHGDTDQPYHVQRNIAFCSMSGVGCSEWLTAKLADIGEQQLYWINAKEPGGRSTSPAFIQELMPRRIIALGQMAVLWCKRSGYPYTVIPHPQYWERFHYKEEYPLAQCILEALHGSKEEHTSEGYEPSFEPRPCIHDSGDESTPRHI